MQEKLKELRENCLIDVSKWWGLGNAGYDGIIVTKDHILYSYTYHHREEPYFKTNNIPKEKIFQGITISPESLNKINDFIKTKIISQEYEGCRVFDAGWIVCGNYEGQSFNLYNVFNDNDEPYLYKGALNLLEEISKQDSK